MRTITYNLQNGDYYKDINEFTDKIIKDSGKDLSVIMSDYIKFIVTNNREELRTYEEYLYDMIATGVYMNVYSEYPNIFTLPSDLLLSQLFKIRKKVKAFKKYIDIARGVLITLNYKNKIRTEKVRAKKNLKTLKRLILFLEATGEFREEVIRIRMFSDFLNSINQFYAEIHLKTILDFSEIFGNESVNSLGKYIPNLEEFQSNELKNHYWKEDLIFCSRKKEEYFLSMVGAELMNRAFEASYKLTSRKVILLPACMREKKNGNCKAVMSNYAMSCRNCSTSCAVYRIQKKAEINNVKVYLIPHSSDFKNWLRLWAYGRNIGILGVACPLNLMTGGLELKSLDIPSKCILLDYCGCSNHWDEKGFPISLNENELNKAIGLHKQSYQQNKPVTCTDLS